MNIESQISFNCVTFEAKYIGMGKVLNSCQVYFPCYCKTSNIGKGQIEVLTSYCFWGTKEKWPLASTFPFKVYAKSVLMQRQIFALREKRASIDVENFKGGIFHPKTRKND